jgi:hypothetical protein
MQDQKPKFTRHHCVRTWAQELAQPQLIAVMGIATIRAVASPLKVWQLTEIVWFTVPKVRSGA